MDKKAYEFLDKKWFMALVAVWAIIVNCFFYLVFCNKLISVFRK